MRSRIADRLLLWFLPTLFVFSGGAQENPIWITEEKVHIDRCASAWLISRFLEPNPEFQFIQQGTLPPEGNTYDFFGAKYFHRGPDCTFTTLIKEFKKADNKALIAMNQTVNDAFGWMNSPNSFASDFRTLISELQETNDDDLQTVTDMMRMFDVFYLQSGGDIGKVLPSVERDVKTNWKSYQAGESGNPPTTERERILRAMKNLLRKHSLGEKGKE